MPLLYSWRGDNYRRDLDFGAGFHLNQDTPALDDIALGDSLWAFARRLDGTYVFAAELAAKARTLNPRRYRCGRYPLWGDLQRSRYVATEGQSDITPLIRSLSVTARGDQLGRVFRGHAAVRRLVPEDDAVLRTYAVSIPLEPRARLLPEERLEALLLTRDEASVAALVQSEPTGLIEARRAYLIGEAIRRSRALVEELRALQDRRCQGGGVFTKRLNDNQHRSIVLAMGGRLWVFAFLSAKKDRANIDPDELTAFRRLARAYARMNPPERARALDAVTPPQEVLPPPGCDPSTGCFWA